MGSPLVSAVTKVTSRVWTYDALVVVVVAVDGAA